MQNINFATATKAELEAAGYTLKTAKSTVRFNRKSAWGARPIINKSRHASAKTLANANEFGTGKIRG